jgi:hypothetical protein
MTNKQDIKRSVIVFLSALALLLIMVFPAQAVEYSNHINPKIKLFFEENVNIIKSTIDGSNVLFTPIKPNNYTAFYYQSALTAEKTYYLFINATGIGNEGYMENFTEPIIIDMTNPVLVSSNPADKSTVYVEDGKISISLSFNEAVKQVKSSLTAADGNKANLTFSKSGYLFNHTATATVSNGLYTFSITAEDLAGNNITKILTFDIVKGLDIALINPKDGASNKTTFNFTVSTSRSANCKYFIDYTNQNLNTLAESYFTELKPNSASTVHSVSIWLKDGSERDVFVLCKGNLGNINLTKREKFKIYVDTTPPKITVQASDITQPPFESSVYIDSDDSVICRFAMQSSKFESMEKIGTDVESYLTDYHIIEKVNDKNKYTYYIGCKNKAGMVTYALASFVVDTSLPVTVDIVKPSKSYYSQTDITIIAATNRDADCSYSINNATAYEKSGSFGVIGKNHTSETISFSQGKNTLYVKCTAERYGNEPITIIKNKKFSVDTTPPVDFSTALLNPVLKDGKTWVTDFFKVNATSSDPQSGVDHYSFEINSTENKNISYTTDWIDVASGSVPYSIYKDSSGKSLKINDLTKYLIAAVAVNNAGLSTDPRYIPFFVDRSLRPAACKNGLFDIKNETDIDCGGACEKCADAKSCASDADCRSNQCKNKVCTAPSCFDLLKNGDETDADCGGSCGKCADSKLCKSGNDCMSTVCSAVSGKCVSFKQYQCTNAAKDGSETDIDCGGDSCNKCMNGRTCLVNEDCIIANCEENICKKPEAIIPVEPIAPACNDPNDSNCNGIPNEWEIAHGLDPNDPDSGDQLNKDGITFKQQYLNEINNDNNGSSKTFYIVLLIIALIIALLITFYFLQGKEFKIAGKTLRIPVVFRFGKDSSASAKPQQSQGLYNYNQMSQQMPARYPNQQQPASQYQQQQPQQPQQYTGSQYRAPQNAYQSRTAAYLKRKEKEREEALSNFDDSKLK